LCTTVDRKVAYMSYRNYKTMLNTIRTLHAPAINHHKPTPVHQQKPQSAPDDHPWHPRPQVHHFRQRSNTRMGPSPAATSLPPAHVPSADNTLISAPLPHSRSYAQALKGQDKSLAMSEIRQLLNYFSAQLTTWESTPHTNICLTRRKKKSFINKNYIPCTLEITLSISIWDIKGLNSTATGLKSSNTEFQKSIKEMDIIILQETWSRADAITHCPPNYREIVLPSQKLNTVRQGRDSGGQIIWYKFHNHINTVKQGKYYTWLKIHKELLSSRKVIFLCAIYILPSESPYYSEDMFSTLEEETSHFQAQGNVLICGDLNARTGLQPDFTDTQGSKYINNKLTVINTTFSHIHRNNHDHRVNKNGKYLIQLCRSLGLYIINGRLRGDTLGRFTFCSPLGDSTVDCMITDIDPSSLRSFTVGERTPLSDHSQITAYLKNTENNIRPVSCEHTDGLKTALKNIRKNLAAKKYKYW